MLALLVAKNGRPRMIEISWSSFMSSTIKFAQKMNLSNLTNTSCTTPQGLKTESHMRFMLALKLQISFLNWILQIVQGMSNFPRFVNFVGSFFIKNNTATFSQGYGFIITKFYLSWENIFHKLGIGGHFLNGIYEWYVNV